MQKTHLDEQGLEELIKLIRNDLNTLNDKIDNVVVGDIVKYDGDYEVIPITNGDIMLKTAKTYMSENVVVRKIPYYETSNTSGGDTVYIGSEV